jgi:Aspartyl protease
MLTLNGEAFSCGRSTFRDHDPGRSEPTAKVFIRIRLGQIEFLARLDTGAAWSVMTAELAEAAGATNSGTETTMHTLYGSISGSLAHVPITFVAEEGHSLDVDSTFLISRTWPHGIYLGYSGLLSSIRFALDPPHNAFYFGES